MFNGKRRSTDKGAVKVERFWIYLANELHVSNAIRIRYYRLSYFCLASATSNMFFNGQLEIQALLREAAAALELIGLIQGLCCKE